MYRFCDFRDPKYLKRTFLLISAQRQNDGTGYTQGLWSHHISSVDKRRVVTQSNRHVRSSTQAIQ